jgi:hypothetical protein
LCNHSPERKVAEEVVLDSGGGRSKIIDGAILLVL